MTGSMASPMASSKTVLGCARTHRSSKPPRDISADQARRGVRLEVDVRAIGGKAARVRLLQFDRTAIDAGDLGQGLDLEVISAQVVPPCFVNFLKEDSNADALRPGLPKNAQEGVLAGPGAKEVVDDQNPVTRLDVILRDQQLASLAHCTRAVRRNEAFGHHHAALLPSVDHRNLQTSKGGSLGEMRQAQRRCCTTISHLQDLSDGHGDR
eukprot:scaffold803_cov310-Pinguiococcus_pyrenoidosus.AAC.102